MKEPFKFDVGTLERESVCARREREKKGEGEREGGRKTDSMKPVVYLHTVGSRPHQVKVYPYLAVVTV